jgi:hypothetical protein
MGRDQRRWAAIALADIAGYSSWGATKRHPHHSKSSRPRAKNHLSIGKCADVDAERQIGFVPGPSSHRVTLCR